MARQEEVRAGDREALEALADYHLTLFRGAHRLIEAPAFSPDMDLTDLRAVEELARSAGVDTTMLGGLTTDEQRRLIVMRAGATLQPWPSEKCRKFVDRASERIAEVHRRSN